MRQGFAGVAGLANAVDWRRLVRETIADVERRRGRLAECVCRVACREADRRTTSAQTAVRLLDGISNRLCV